MAEEIPEAAPAQPSRRSAAKHAAIIAATVELLESQGAGALSVEGIASRARVGKQTIYRRWPNAAAIVMEAYRDRIFSPVAPASPDRSARKQLLADLLGLAERFSRPGTRKAFASMAFSAETNPELDDDFRRIVFGPRREAVFELLKIGQARGEIRADVNFEIVADALYGPLIHRLTTGHAPLDSTFVRGLVKELFRGLKP